MAISGSLDSLWHRRKTLHALCKIVMSSQNLAIQTDVIGVAEQLSKLKEAIALSDLERGTLLYVPGDTADRLFFLISGRVKISAPSRGGKQCILQLVEPGQIFGESMLFGHRRREATAEVIEKASVSVIPGEAACSFAESHPEFWKSYSQQLGDRVRDLEEQVQWVTFLEVEQRIARLLLRWGESHPSGTLGRMQLHLSQRDVAGLVGATRETTSAALNRLRRDGCLSIGRRCLVVESVDRLARHTGEPQDHPPIGPDPGVADPERAREHSAGR